MAVTPVKKTICFNVGRGPWGLVVVETKMESLMSAGRSVTAQIAGSWMERGTALYLCRTATIKFK